MAVCQHCNKPATTTILEASTGNRISVCDACCGQYGIAVRRTPYTVTYGLPGTIRSIDDAVIDPCLLDDPSKHKKPVQVSLF